MQFRYLLCDAKNIFTNTHTCTFTCMSWSIDGLKRLASREWMGKRTISTFSVLLIHRTCMYIYFLFVFCWPWLENCFEYSTNSIQYVMCLSFTCQACWKNNRTTTNITNFNFKLFKLREKCEIKKLVFWCTFQPRWKFLTQFLLKYWSIEVITMSWMVDVFWIFSLVS